MTITDPGAGGPSIRRPWRHGLVDIVFRRADTRIETVVRCVSLAALFFLLLFLLGFLGAPTGARGGIDLPELSDAQRRSPNLPLIVQAFRTGAPLPLEAGQRLEDLNETDRAWLTRHMCSRILADGAERKAIAYYIQNHASLCPALARRLNLAPLNVSLGVIPGVLVAFLLLAGVGWAGHWLVGFARGVRLAYRRLYVSEHRAQFDERVG